MQDQDNILASIKKILAPPDEEPDESDLNDIKEWEPTLFEALQKKELRINDE